MTERSYHDARNHGLPHDPLKAIVAPRPIGWISTYASDGTANLAPYSFFNLVSDDPKIVMFASTGWKDSATNAIERGAFAVNLATYARRADVNASSASLPKGNSEFEAIGAAALPCRGVDAPMLGDVPAALECIVTEHLVPKDRGGADAKSVVVFGEVVGYHLARQVMRDGLFDTATAQPLARLGYRDYADVRETFALDRPR